MCGVPMDGMTQSITQLAGTAGQSLYSAPRYTIREPAMIIAIVNLKGGCGKSTIAVNLACELAANGEKVLLVDNDAQGTSTHWLSHNRLPVKGEFMPLENTEDGDWLVRMVSARTE